MLQESQQENAQLQSILEYLRSSSAQSAAALLGRIRQGLTTEELTEYMESVTSSSQSINPTEMLPSRAISDLSTRQSTSSSSWTTVTDDQVKVKHIVDLYFCWQHQCVPVLCRAQFIEAMQNGNDDFCSSVLVNAILAVGSLFYEADDLLETQHDVRILGEQFMEEADRLIQEELIQGRSSVTSVQALVIMSMRDVAAGKDAIMWFHLGLATMMSINLVLDMDTAHDTSPQKQCGRTTYWGLFGADRYVSYIT